MALYWWVAGHTLWLTLRNVEGGEATHQPCDCQKGLYASVVVIDSLQLKFVSLDAAQRKFSQLFDEETSKWLCAEIAVRAMWGCESLILAGEQNQGSQGKVILGVEKR